MEALGTNQVAVDDLPDVQDLTDIDQQPDLQRKVIGSPTSLVSCLHLMPLFSGRKGCLVKKETTDRKMDGTRGEQLSECSEQDGIGEEAAS